MNAKQYQRDAEHRLMLYEYHQMEERVAALEDEREDLREALKAFRETVKYTNARGFDDCMADAIKALKEIEGDA